MAWKLWKTGGMGRALMVFNMMGNGGELYDGTPIPDKYIACNVVKFGSSRDGSVVIVNIDTIIKKALCIGIYVTFIVSVVEEGGCSSSFGEGIIRKSAFDVLIKNGESGTSLPTCEEGGNNFNMLKNKIIGMLDNSKARFPADSAKTDGKEFLRVVAKALSYVDGHPHYLALLQDLICQRLTNIVKGKG